MIPCLASIVAGAEITRNLPPLRSYINAVDTGAIGGVRGAVAIVDSSPSSSRIADYGVRTGPSGVSHPNILLGRQGRASLSLHSHQSFTDPLC